MQWKCIFGMTTYIQSIYHKSPIFQLFNFHRIHFKYGFNDEIAFIKYFPDQIRAKEPPIVNPTIKTYDCFHHHIDDVGKLQKYIMLSSYNKIKNTKETNFIM